MILRIATLEDFLPGQNHSEELDELTRLEETQTEGIFSAPDARDFCERFRPPTFFLDCPLFANPTSWLGIDLPTQVQPIFITPPHSSGLLRFLDSNQPCLLTLINASI